MRNGLLLSIFLLALNGTYHSDVGILCGRLMDIIRLHVFQLSGISSPHVSLMNLLCDVVGQDRKLHILQIGPRPCPAV